MADFDTSIRDPASQEMRQASGDVTSHQPLVQFFYFLLRDHLVASDVEEILDALEKAAGRPCSFSNGFLAKYGAYCAHRIKRLEV